MYKVNFKLKWWGNILEMKLKNWNWGPELFELKIPSKFVYCSSFSKFRQFLTYESPRFTYFILTSLINVGKDRIYFNFIWDNVKDETR